MTVTTRRVLLTPEQAHARAAIGAAWMDEVCSDWFARIDTEALELADSDLCVWGQTAPCLVPDEYEPNLTGFSRVAEHRDLKAGWIEKHGFDAPNGSATEYEMLTIAWREQIRARLAARDGTSATDG